VEVAVLLPIGMAVPIILVPVINQLANMNGFILILVIFMSGKITVEHLLMFPAIALSLGGKQVLLVDLMPGPWRRKISPS
jgi:hypothetical protein